MNGWRIYTHRPIEVEAVQVGNAPWQEVAEWCGGSVIKDGRKYGYIMVGGTWAKKGDYIVCEPGYGYQESTFMVVAQEDFERLYHTEGRDS